MNTIGFPISHKENENRRAITPTHIRHLSEPGQLYFEAGYGLVLGIPDEAYQALGCHICSREEVLKQDVICDPKIGDAEYLGDLSEGQTIFGWVHATQNVDITDHIVNNKLTAYAWENMFDQGRHVFWRNNELAGEAAVMHAFQCWGRMPYECSVAVIGRGNTARGAIKVLNMLGAQVVQYDRRTEALLRQEIGLYDVIVNCILWDVNRTDHVISLEDLRRMKSGSMIVDVSCDHHGGVESCIPTTIEQPTYYAEGILHYAVDHTPSLYYKTFTNNNSNVLYPYIDELIHGTPGKVLRDSLIIERGVIIDQQINIYQNRI